MKSIDSLFPLFSSTAILKLSVIVNVAKFTSSALATHEYANYISIVLFSTAVLDYPIN